MPDTETRLAPLSSARRREDLPLTVVSEGDTLVGRLDMSGNGQVLGSLEGHISCPGELLVGPGADIRADIEAHDLVLAGRVVGNVVVRRRLKITTTGRLTGDAQVGSLVVQEGGVHFGLLHVYPDGLPEVAPVAVAALEAGNGMARRDGRAGGDSRSPGQRPRPLAASIDRVRRMWGEIF